jgi:biopolymer transport protein ExbD
MTKQTDRISQDTEMDMTPMIDCVFLLMIFFVLVIDLSQKDLEDLILPPAKYAVPDENPPEVRPIINITQDGHMVYKANTYYEPAQGENIEGIKRLLLEWKASVVQDTEEQNLGGRTVTLVNDPILVRADKWTEWHYVGVFMTACSQPEAAFWKIELAMAEEDKEKKMMQGR